jgi:L-ascorbate metabolism protein UlaG (beta-lactamase superfamily)
MRKLLILTLLTLAACAPRVAVPPTAGEPATGLRIVRAGHATVWVDLNGFRVLTDPVFMGWLWAFPRRDELGLDPQHLPPVDAVVVSHTHMDHFDPWSIAQVKARVPVLFPAATTQPLVKGDLYRDMVRGKPTYELAWWHSVTIKNREGRVARLTAVPAAHWGGRLGFDGAWGYNYGGWVLESGGHTVYFAGDTGWNPAYFQEIAARFPHIEVALIPIGPVWSREAGASRMTRHHVNPAQALEAFQILKADYFVPIHYGSFYGLGDEALLPWLREESAHRPAAERVAIVPPGVEWRYRPRLGFAEGPSARAPAN